MADGATDEKRSIRDSARSLKRYGSTSSQRRPEHLIKHVVCKTDTLQGLALRYGVTTEQIRRANRLFANDSLFIREFLMIPVPDTDGLQSSAGSTSASLVSSPASPMSPSSSTENGFSDEHSIDEFLDKIDSSIASTKHQVQKVQGSSSLYSEDDIFSRKRPPVSRLRQQNQHQIVAPTSSEILSPPHPIVMTQGRKVRTSLQRLQREQDEMFEL
ncbi:LysM and putative peptidoglycan-binding domain-containing protein 2 [Frankliniella fusca]|uniref:LysM and putative peptidoglycan-binding domain-containing protein 2 n=1 Tax=Frankliniella fusca TaxID=407009 RepID=A0AAE1LTK3_9NEOP|nr:LysM and putative peptidoglycan-binding domain-containing protein 2 [Frankliniella fusca]